MNKLKQILNSQKIVYFINTKQIYMFFNKHETI